MTEDAIKALAAQASALRRAGHVREAIAAYEKLLAPAEPCRELV